MATINPVQFKKARNEPRSQVAAVLPIVPTCRMHSTVPVIIAVNVVVKPAPCLVEETLDDRVDPHVKIDMSTYKLFSFLLVRSM